MNDESFISRKHCEGTKRALSGIHSREGKIKRYHLVPFSS